MNYFVTIVVPVYNVYDYLRACVDSILNQTYKKYEIILVDDGSPDQSSVLCDEYASSYENISAIHQKNGGAANARNHGLDMATGEYICFIDSDDKIENNYVEKLLGAIKENKAEVVVCSFKQWYKDKTQDSEGFENKEYSSKDYIRKFLSDWTKKLWSLMSLYIGIE